MTVREADVDGVDLVLRPSPTIEGQIVAQGGTFADLKLKTIYFQSSTSPFGFGFASVEPDQDGKFALSLRPGKHKIGFDPVLADAEKVTVDGQPVTDMSIQMEPGSSPKKLVMELKPKAKP